jgi:hypothetical protein
MAGKNTATFAIFATRSAAESAVDRLIAAGFSNQDVSVLMSDNTSSREFATEKNTKAPEGTATGVGVGGVVGGTLGLLAGLGALAIPGVGPLIAAGPIMGALAGLGVGGAVGGLVGALVGMGIPEYEAKRYEGRVKDGGILVSVHCDTSEEISRAKDVLKQAGGEDIASSGEKSVSSHTASTDKGHTDADRLDTARERVYERDVTTGTTVADEELVADRSTRP